MTNANVYLKLFPREDWTHDIEDASEKSIIGYYKVIVSQDSFHESNLNQEIMIDIVKEALGDDVCDDRIIFESGNVKAYCYKGAGDYVDTLKQMYYYKNEVEEKVYKKLSKAGIHDYTIIINLTTLYI